MGLLLCVSRGGRKKKNLLTRDQSVSPSTPILASSPFTFWALAKVEKIRPSQFCLEMEVAETIRGSLRTRAKCRVSISPQPTVEVDDLVIGKDVPELRDLSEPSRHHRLHHPEGAAHGRGVVVARQRGH